MTSYDEFTNNAVEAAIRVGVIALLALLCLQILEPFAVAILWGAIIAIAIYPVHQHLERILGGRSAIAATLLTLAMLLVLVVPAALLGRVLTQNVQVVIADAREGTFAIPPPPDSVRHWPLIGSYVAELWRQASENLANAAQQFAPQIKDVGTWLLETAAGAGLGFLQFVASVFIAGLFLARADDGRRFAYSVGRRLGGEQGSALVDLVEATVRNVTRGVLGVALVQALLAGIGLFAAGVPISALWTVVALILAVLQIGVWPVLVPAVIYVFAVESYWTATIFLIWSAVVSVIDNVLRPLLIGRGLDVPMLVILIGTIGGLLYLGIIGLFIGAVILALGYKLLLAWIELPQKELLKPLDDAGTERPQSTRVR